jgi:hypothetical protein
MTPAGWIVMILSIGFVLSLVTFCFGKLLLTPTSTSETMHTPLDIDTHD